VAGAPAGGPASGQPRPPQGGQTQALQVLSSTGTQSKEKKTHPGPQQGGPASSDDKGSTQVPAKRQRSSGGGPASSDDKGPTQGPAKRQRSSGGTPWCGRAKKLKIGGPSSYAQVARKGIQMAIVCEGYPEVQVSKENFGDI